MYRKLVLPMMVIVVAIALAFGAMAFSRSESKTANKKATLVQYHYTSNSTASEDILNGNNYDSGAASSCNGGTAMPCTIQFDNATYPTVQDYLTAQGSASVVISNAVTRKH